MPKGIVYVLTNRAMPGWVKIGRCQPENLDQRITQLSNTSVPYPFECEYAALVDEASTVEARVHRVLGSVRRNPSREFFEMPADVAIEALLLTSHEDVTPGRDFAASQEDREALDEARKAEIRAQDIDCLIVSASDAIEPHEVSFEDVFLNQKRWWEFRMADQYRQAVKWVAAYRTRPHQQVTHLGYVSKFEPSPTGKSGRWMAVFSAEPEVLACPIPLGDNAPNGLMQSPRYCNKERLLQSRSLSELFGSA